MRRHLSLALTFALVGSLLWITPAEAGPRERQIKQLEAKLKNLHEAMRRAMTFRSKFANLRANSYFFDRLLRQDRKLLRRVLGMLNNPVTLNDAFLSWVNNNFAKAKKNRGKYNPPSTYLWLDCRFGLMAVKARSYYTIRVDIVDARSGVRIFQSLKPQQRRITRAKETIPVRIHGLKMAGGSYQIRVVVEVGRGSAKRLVRFKYNRNWRPRRR